MLLKAIQKIDLECLEFKGGQKAAAVYRPVADALKSFCRQDNEFAQAVVQCEKTLSDCCTEIVKDVGSAISDIDVYHRAVQFYFPGAEIEMNMKIQLNPFESNTKSSAADNIINLSLDDLFE